VPKIYTKAASVELGFEALPSASDASYWVDGLVAAERPVTVPTLVQLQLDGALHSSSYLWPGMALPELQTDGRSRDRNAAMEHSIDVPSRRRVHVPLAVSAGVSALAAAGSYAMAHNTAADYRDNPHSNAQLEELRARANTLVYVSVGLGTVALGTGVGAAVAWPR